MEEDLAALPLVINVLVAWSIEGLVLGVVIDADRAGLADLPATRAALAGRAESDWLNRAFLLEAAWATGLDYDDPEWLSLGWDDDNPVPWALRGIAGRLWRRHDLAFNAERLRDLARLTDTAYPVAVPQAEAIAARHVPAVFPISRMGLDLGQSALRTAAVWAMMRELCGWAARRGAVVAPDPAPTDPLVGGALRRWESPDGGVVLWSAEAAASATLSGFRSQLVWRIGTDALPPDLVPFADEINGVD